MKGKTVSVALSKEQYEALKEAIENWREVESTLDRMQKLTRQRIFGTLDRKSTRLNSSHIPLSRMPSSA